MATLCERSIMSMGRVPYAVTLPRAWLGSFRVHPDGKAEVMTDGETVIRLTGTHGKE